MAAFNHINRLLDRIPNAQVLIDGTVDDHLYVFKDAKHLALHRGGISQALSILNKNNIYINPVSYTHLDVYKRQEYTHLYFNAFPKAQRCRYSRFNNDPRTDLGCLCCDSRVNPCNPKYGPNYCPNYC